ncbi:putative toxin complex component ORF-X2 [Clostridium botulinum]|uniref:TULIP family P47-like protein n=1 Tax=Clostridium botulinum TaxID=1491 RepID=UPI000581E79B|nr:TULIP family P47-like protein [Clostridium botulinum]BAQ12791.1 putative toxin complex component ORF-X2 [Clostridium botulinum]
MNKSLVTPLYIYKWEEIAKKVNNDEKIQNNMKKEFFYKREGTNNVFELSGLWKKWEIDKGSNGCYPIFRCLIKNGVLTIRNNKKEDSYPLDNVCIKFGIKVKFTEDNFYFIPKEDNTIYVTASSFISDNLIIKTVFQNLFISFLKANIKDLNDFFFSMGEIPSEKSSDLSLLGWDMNYSTSFTNMNKVIKEQKLYPDIIFQELPDHSAALEGAFNLWEMTTGADGQNVWFKCYINKDTRLYGTALESNFDYNFDEDSYVKIQVKLDAFNNTENPIEDPTGNNDGEQKLFKLKLDVVGDDNVVTVVGQKIPTNIQNDSSASFTFSFLIGEWFKENIQEFTQIFSYFQLNETAKDPNFTWVKPTTVYYGVASVEDDLDRSIFSVLSMVENGKSPETHIVDNRILQETKTDSALALDIPLYVKHWLLQALITLQVGTLEQFEISPNGMMITNKERIKYATLADKDWENAPAYINKGNFKLGVINNQIIFELVDIQIPKNGIVIHLDFKQIYDLILKSGTDNDGNNYSNVLIAEEIGDPIYRIMFTEESWVKWKNLCVNIAAGIAIGIAFGAIMTLGTEALGQLLRVTEEVAETSGDIVSISSETNVEALNVPFQRYLQTVFIDDTSSVIEALSRESISDIMSSITDETGSIISTTETTTNIINTARPIGYKIGIDRFKFLAGTIAASMGALIPEEISNIIEDVNNELYSNLPTIQPFINNLVNVVQWPNNSEFQISDVKLFGLYLMGGTTR